MYENVICYIDSLQMGGAERVMANLCNYFVKVGKRVVLINDVFSEKDNSEYNVDSRIKRLFLPYNRNGRVLSNFRRIRDLRKIFISEKPDIVISFLGPCNLRALIANLGLRSRLLVSVRNDPYKEYGCGLKKTICDFLFHFADGVVFQTPNAAAYFSKTVQKKSRILFNPVHSKFYKVEWNGLNKEIAVVGRLQQQKNPLLAVEAFKKICNDFSDYKLVFYGDGELKKDILKKCEEYGLLNNVIVYGKCSNIETKMAESSLFLLTSDYEGMPNALLEAMAVGLPVIATDCPCGGPKIATLGGSVGILVDCGDSDKIADAVKKILLNNELQKKISVMQRKRALDFNENVVFKMWDKYINDIFAERKLKGD